jgi:protein involved in polysaccharide export with SLBB domain
MFKSLISMNLTRGFFTVLFSFAVLFLSAQIPSDLSNIKSSQISDAQLRQYIQQAKANGVKQEQFESELNRRGLPPEEIDALRTRIKTMDEGATEMDSNDEPIEQISRSGPKITSPSFDLFETKKRSRVFGADLFTNSNLTFEPNLRMATPRSYTIGPDDELILNVYGLNMSQQKLIVSPEGTVNVKYAGIINVNGLSVEAATAVMKNRLTKYYPALRSGDTKLQLSLGNIRSIRVIIIGAVNKPGTYTLPSLATLFNALYASGGPLDNGSFRKIQLIRNNKVIETADLYDFLTKGSQTGNLRLEDNDVIRVPFAELMVTLNGEVNTPGIFELQTSESLSEALQFAGGFKSNAFRARITGTRFTDFDKKVLDISGDSLRYFKPKNGDEYFIDSVINRYQNRVIVSGAVFKPGAYALEPGMTLKNLISKAHGLKEDVYAGRAILVRTREDLSKEYISVELNPLIEGNENGIVLKKEDSLYIASIFDLKDTVTVTINGAVRKPGTYRYESNLSLRSLVMKAEGFSDNATGMGIEISRRKRDVEINKAGSNIVDIITVDDNLDLSNNANDIPLKPFDIITIKEDPFYKKQISVKISGEVLLPAVYTLQSREERLSSLIKRSGGLLYTANIGGAKLIRKRNEVTDTTEIKRLLRSVERDTTRRKTETLARKTTDVAIDLAYILKHPGSIDDITLEEGDELVIPRINNTVIINGEVFKPVEVMYESGKKMKDYLSDAGGVTQSGKKSKAFVIYVNGRSAKIRKVLGIFRKYPRMEPGSNIFVPQKPKREGVDVAKAGIFISAVTALITAASLILR